MSTYVFDLDGTICSQEHTGTYHLAAPKRDVIKRVNQLYDSGHTIMIFTARGMVTCRGDLAMIHKTYWKLTEDWLKSHNVKYHELKFGKPAADFYIDDKGINVDDFVKL